MPTSLGGLTRSRYYFRCLDYATEAVAKTRSCAWEKSCCVALTYRDVTGRPIFRRCRASSLESHLLGYLPQPSSYWPATNEPSGAKKSKSASRPGKIWG